MKRAALIACLSLAIAASFVAGSFWRERLYKQQLHEIRCTATTHIVIPQLDPPKGYKCA